MAIDRDARSTLIVLLVALASLTAGWTVRGSAIDPVRRVTTDDLSVELPADWLAASGTGDVAITARSLDPMIERVQIGVVPLDKRDTLESVATNRGAAQALHVDGYRVVGEGPDEVDGRPAHAVAYAFLESEEGMLPTVVEGLAYFIRFGDHVVVAAVEADTTHFDDALEGFGDVLASIEFAEGPR